MTCRLLAMPLFLVVAACVEPPAGGGGSPTTPPSTVPVKLNQWDTERKCFSWVEIERPAEFWGEWTGELHECGRYDDTTAITGYYTYGTADGDCISVEIGFFGETPGWEHCIVDDPWLLPCEESAVDVCCEVTPDRHECHPEG
jgi:hypothetical protein